MYNKQQRPSEIIALQKQVIAEQEGIIEILKGALAAAGAPSPEAHRPWMVGLTPQECAMMGALFHRYPKPIGNYELMELMPGRDHVVDRQAQVVTVKVHHLRRKLGADAIENVRGMGYRLGQLQHARMEAEAAQVGPRPAHARDPLRVAA